MIFIGVISQAFSSQKTVGNGEYTPCTTFVAGPELQEIYIGNFLILESFKKLNHIVNFINGQ